MQIRWVAVGALGCTVIGSIMIMVKEGISVCDHHINLVNVAPISATDTDPNTSNCHGQNFVPNHPSPKSPLDFGQAFSSIMFSFAGASTFPTIQADMRNREKFPTAAVYAMLSKNRLLWRVFKMFTPYPSFVRNLPPHVRGRLVAARGQGGGECRGLSV